MDLDELLGLPEASRVASAATPDPMDVLANLRFGQHRPKSCLPRDGWRSTKWVRIQGMPVETEMPNAFEEMLRAAIGVSSRFEVAMVRPRADAQAALYLGFLDALDERVGRSLIAPDWEVEPGRAPTAPQLRFAAGVMYRWEALPGAGSGGKALGRSAVERLAAVPGPWLVSWQLSGLGAAAIDRSLDLALRLEDLASGHRTMTIEKRQGTSITVERAGWVAVSEWLVMLRRQLVLGRAEGMWSLESHVEALDARAFDSLRAALRFPLPHTDDEVTTARILDRGPGVAPVSYLSTSQVGSLLAAPRQSVPGLRVRPAPPGGRQGSGRGRPILLGTASGTDSAMEVDVADLEGHGFVTGTTGSGKTTTVSRLLAGLWNDHGVPFLIIDPVKDDYAATAGTFRGGLRVIRARDLRVNLLEPWPGEVPEFHIGRITQCFRGAFSLPSPVPYVVTQLFDRINQQDSGPGASNLFDIEAALPSVVASLGYDREVESNIRASLMTRLNLLLSPTRAARYAWPNSAMLRDILAQPTVLTLADLADDEERSFVVLMVAIAVWQAARARRNPKKIEHVLVLEEAHRVLPEVGSGGSGGGEVSDGSAEQQSAQLLTDLLAEVRSYGQQVLVVDQSPARVAQDVVRNTNLKIVHRLPHPGDQQHAGGAIGLTAENAIVLGGLQVGQALLSTRSEPSAQSIQVTPLPPAQARVVCSLPIASIGDAWPCCGPDPQPKAVAKHYQAWGLARTAEAAAAILAAGARGGAGNGVELRRQVYASLSTAAAAAAGLSRGCLLWTALRRLLYRERAVGRLTSVVAFEQSLTEHYACWASREPITEAAAGLSKASRAAFACPYCGTRCRTRVLAEATVRNQPIGGLLSTWDAAGGDLARVARWLARWQGVLTVTLGELMAQELSRCSAGYVVTLRRLPPEVLEEVMALTKANGSGSAT